MAKSVQKDTQSNRGKGKRNHQIRGEQQKAKKPRILVGTPWPEGITVHNKQPHQHTKEQVIVGIAVLSGLLLVGFVSYAMAHADQDILKQTFKLVEWGLSFAAGWAGGKASK